MLNKARSVSRVLFFLLAVSVLIYLSTKADNNVRSIAEFKFDMLQKIQADSLDSKHKLNAMLKETTRFIEDSSHVREGIRYLIRLLELFAVVELGFFILSKRNSPRPQ